MRSTRTRYLFLLAGRNLKQHRLRTVLTALSVARGTATIVAANVTGSAIRDAGQALEQAATTVALAGDFLSSGLDLCATPPDTAVPFQWPSGSTTLSSPRPGGGT